MKLEKLTPEQEALIPIFKDKWINQLFDLKGVNTPQLLNGIEWLYTFCKMEVPRVIVCKSILEAQLTIHVLKNITPDNVGDNVWDNVWANVGANVGANVWDNVRDNVWANVGANVRANVGDNVWDNVGDNVWDNVWDNVGANVRDNVWDNVGANVRANVWANVGANVRANVGANVRANVGDNVWDNEFELEPMCSYGDINDYGWVAFHDFFTEIGVNKNENFNNFSSLLKSNYYSMIQMTNLCVVIENPKHILLDEEKRMNSTNDYAIKFKDDTGMHFVNGMYLSDELFNKLKSKEYTFDDFSKESNEEIKSACISFLQQEFGDVYLFDFLSQSLKEIDTFVDNKEDRFLIGTTNSKNVGVYTLYKGSVNNIDVAYIRCYCHSTDRMFFLGIDPVNENAKDGIASLYRVPKKLKANIKYIQRQGERFSTVFDDQGTLLLKEGKLSKEDIQDTVAITGDEYFGKIKFEY